MSVVLNQSDVNASTGTVPPLSNGKGSKSKGSKSNSVQLSTPAKSSLLGSSNNATSKVASLSDVRRIAKDMVKQLQTVAKPSTSANSLATIVDNTAHWARVDCIKNGFESIESPAMRKLLIAQINAELAEHGLESLKNQDFRHWACAAKIEKDFPNIDFRQYSETAMEKTALKWYKGSFSDLVENGVDAFAPKKDEKVKVGDDEYPVDMLIDNMEASMIKYAAPKKKEKVTITRKERVEKSATKLVKWMKKEYSAEKGQLTAFILQFIHQLANTPATENKQDGTKGMTMLEVYQAAIGE